LGLGCAQPGDGARFGQALHQAQSDLDQGLARCQEIERADLRDYCLVSVAELGGEPGQASQLCALPQQDLWRDECQFALAERAAHLGEAERAAQLCGAAGQFAQKCKGHVWHLMSRADLTAALDTRGQAAALMRAVAYHLTLDVAPDSGHAKPWQKDLAWQRSLRLAMQRQKRADASLCDHLADPALVEAVPALRPGRCLDLYNQALSKQIARVWSRDTGAMEEALCSWSGNDSTAPWPGPGPEAALDWRDDGRLRPGLLQAAQRHCRSKGR